MKTDSSTGLPYHDFSTWIKERLPYKVQKISIDAGMTCPNRDGHIGLRGCTFCNNKTFTPGYCDPKDDIKTQLEKGKMFFQKKYPEMKFLAYFQSYTNTYQSLEVLKQKYEEALEVKDVVGLIIGTRPDCVSIPLLDYFKELNKRTFLILEYGVESTDDDILRHINRGHDFECSRQAILQTAQRGINTCIHMIIGLPGENKKQLINQAQLLSQLPINMIKLHQLQIIKGTPLHQEYTEKPFHIYDVNEYIETIAEYIKYLRKNIVIERFVSQSPGEMVFAPKWKLKNHEFTHKLLKYLHEHGITQGINCP